MLFGGGGLVGWLVVLMEFVDFVVVFVCVCVCGDAPMMAAFALLFLCLPRIAPACVAAWKVFGECGVCSHVFRFFIDSWGW
jgi:hypothetical protein